MGLWGCGVQRYVLRGSANEPLDQAAEESVLDLRTNDGESATMATERTTAMGGI